MSPDPSNARLYDVPLGENAIRLVRLFKFPDGSISGELQYFQLKDRIPPFIATSYVWGDQDERCTIKLNGHSVDNLKNAHKFFEELLTPNHYEQFPPSTTWWWMDCICINQEDPAERSAQVGLMSTLYRQAAKTVIWLGEESADSDVGMGFLQLLAEDYTGTEEDELYWNTNIRPHIAANSPGWKAVENLLTRKWWERVWTLQEYLLSKQGFFFCGSKRISFKQMTYAINSVWHWHQRRDSRIISREGYEKAWNRLRLVVWQDYVSRARRHLPLVALLTYTSTSSVTDPRDRLYSLLGLISPSELDMIGRPDYESSAASIYTRFAISFILKYRTLDLLCIGPEMKENLSSNQNKEVLHLPSWVPDWSLRRRHSPPLLCMANQSASPHMGNFRPLHMVPWDSEYRACGLETAFPEGTVSFSNDCRELLCQAITLDEIDGLGGGRMPDGGHDEEEDGPYLEETVQSTSRVNNPTEPLQTLNKTKTLDKLGISITHQVARSLVLDRGDPYLGDAAPVNLFARELRHIGLQQQQGLAVELFDSRSRGLYPPDFDCPDSTAEIAEWFNRNKHLHIKGMTLEEAITGRSGHELGHDHDGHHGSDNSMKKASDAPPSTSKENTVTELAGSDPQQAMKFATRFRSTAFRRAKRLMVTSTGILGMAPRRARKGDLVCVLLGCNIPLVLRADHRQEGDIKKYTVIGEAYVDGYMNGESVADMDNGIRNVENLRIV
ncbi:heterokaryon incompatibility protein-domain-containing protein [Rhypophila decipiens]|uniref:Heterokaryon incompatibility protein-domain-containing protein n=1 Tax=Rhypophila decipiens TaxID=261697 RepID=A0AAN6YA91_9PEZI|nr:heterokaryon incompatibility protein-domain-containing protein [Rhypophila decipiens]